jgi:very-short-patch-repair endonuclease
MSIPERTLWNLLRQNTIGLKWRRQHPIGRYVADFYCAAARLIVELDGESHGASSMCHDADRQAALEALGFQVVRVTNRDVGVDAFATALHICKLAQAAWRPSPQPSPCKGEGARAGGLTHG